MLRAGGYFMWAAQPVYKHEDKLQEQWRGNMYFNKNAQKGFITKFSNIYPLLRDIGYSKYLTS